MATGTGILLADMANHPDLGWDDIELFRDDLIDFCQHLPVVGAVTLVLGYLVDDLYPG